MRKAISTYSYVQERLTPSVLDRLAQGGAEEFELFCSRNHFDYHSRPQVREIAQWFRDNGRELHSMHAPMYFGAEWPPAGLASVNFVAADKRARIEAMDEIKRALEVAETLAFRYLVQHIGDGGEAFDARKFDHALSAVEHLKSFAKPLGVMLLVENIPNEMATPERLVELIEMGHFKDVGVCFDTGHAHMGRTDGLPAGIEHAYELLKPLIRSTHVHDNNGVSDDHLWPGAGTIDWKRTVELLREAPQRPPLLIEASGEDGAPVPQRFEETSRRLLGGE